MVRSVTQMRFRQLLDAAAILKPRVAVFHAAYDKWRYSGRKDIWLENSVETWCKVVDSASRIGMGVAVENVFEEDPDALAMLIEKIGSRDFGFCFDTGHMNLFSTVPMEQWFGVLGKNIIEVHLHDNDGTEDSHWALGRGGVDFQEFFRLPAQTPTTPDLHDRGPRQGRRGTEHRESEDATGERGK